MARAELRAMHGQVGNGAISGTINPVSQTAIRYPWIDANKNKSADAGEITLGPNPLALVAGNWSATNPGATTSSNSVDPNLKDDTTDEFIVGLDREVGGGFAVGASYIWRRYGNFNYEDRVGISTADWVARTFTPAASTCPGADNRTEAATCPTVTYFEPSFQQPTLQQRINVPGYNRTYNGFEVTGRKRMSNHWLMNTSFSFNSATYNYNDFPGSNNMSSGTAGANDISEDPTNRAVRNGFQ